MSQDDSENSNDSNLRVGSPPSALEFSNDSSMQMLMNALRQRQEQELDTGTSRRRYVGRDREKAMETLMEDYFCEEPKFDDDVFRERYRLSKSLFLKIVGDIENSFPWFREGYDGRGKKSFTPIQKCTSALKQLATGNPPDEYDEYLNMSERTSRECQHYFSHAIIQLYGDEFLRRPTSHDVAMLYSAHEDKHHIPGMLGSLDCTHLDWRMCPSELRGQYKRGDQKYPSVMLEVVASNDLWIWHAFCGPPGSNNDLNVLQQSPLFLTERNGTAPECPFTVNGNTYKRGYYLVDGIYHKWAVFVQAYLHPVIPREKKFKKVQESARKDVERAFGVLKAKWGILRRPLRAMTVAKIRNITYACIILHNMIIHDDGNAISPVHIRDPPVEPRLVENALDEIRDEETHFRLRFDLATHVDAQNLPYLDEN